MTDTSTLKELRDDHGKIIDVGSIVEITDGYGIYTAPVVFKDGMFTINPFEAKQIKNQDGWLESLQKTFPNENKKHDQIKSCGFLVHWGEGIAQPIKRFSLKGLKLIE